MLHVLRKWVKQRWNRFAVNDNCVNRAAQKAAQGNQEHDESAGLQKKNIRGRAARVSDQDAG